MSALEIKEEIHRKIDVLEDIGELIDINQSLDWFLTEKLSLEEKTVLQRLTTLMPTLEEGRGVRHEDVQKQMKAWIRK